MKFFIKQIILIIFLASFLNSSAQNLFYKLYDNSGLNDGGLSVIRTFDKGYISCGISFSPMGLFIVKVTQEGDIIWQKYWDMTSGADYAESIIQLADSSFVVCGTGKDTIEGTTDSFLFKISIDGDSIWYKPVEGGYTDWAHAHIQTHDGGFVIGGENYDSAFTSSQIFLLKTDSVGNLEWQQEYGDSAYFDYFYGIDTTYDGGYILSGEFVNPVTSSWDIFLIKTDSLGNQQWKQYYGDAYDQYQGFVQATSDSGYIMVAGSYNENGIRNGLIIKTDSTGNVLWGKTFGLSNFNDHFKYIRQLSDGDFIVAGGAKDTSVNPAKPRIWLMKISREGDSLWSKTYTYYGNSTQFGSTTDDYVEDLSLTSDGGFIMTGYIINNSMPGNNDLFLIKTDYQGNTCEIDTNTWEGCWEYSCSYLHACIGIQQDTFLLSDSVNVQFYDESAFADSWLWDFGDSYTDTAKNPVHTYTDTGVYDVMLIAFYSGCSDTAYTTITILNDVGIQSPITNHQSQINIYPNPATSQLNISYNLESDTWFIIYNLTGNRLADFYLEKGKKIKTISPVLESGIYIYKILSEGSQVEAGTLVILK